MRRQFILFVSVLLLLTITSACALLEGPQRPTIPTPIPTAPPLEMGAVNTGELVYDPVSSIVPAVDPAIVSLLNSVSQQQLMGYVQTLQGFGTRNVFSATDQPDFGVGAARLFIYNEFLRVGNGRLQVQRQSFPLNYNGLANDQENIIATLPGTGDNPGIIVIMAHYDTRRDNLLDGTSRSPGADDNASGVAMLLETARILSSREWNQTVVLAAMAAEEPGSYGARHFVQEAYLTDTPILAAINYDTVGGRTGIPQSIRLFAPELNTSSSGELARYYDLTSSLYLPTFPLTIIDALDRDNRFGDQREFIRANLPAIRLTESVEDPALLNSVNDSWELIDYAYLQQVTQLNVAMAANALGAPARPDAPSIAPMSTPGDYILAWSPDPNAAGYVISFRPLESANFVPFRFVGANQAGNVALTGYDPETTYGVSMAALDENGRVSLFSPETIVGP